MTGVDAQKPAWSKRAWRLWQHHSQGRRNPKLLQWLPAHETWSIFWEEPWGTWGYEWIYKWMVCIYIYKSVNIYIYTHTYIRLSNHKSQQWFGYTWNKHFLVRGWATRGPIASELPAGHTHATTSIKKHGVSHFPDNFAMFAMKFDAYHHFHF